MNRRLIVLTVVGLFVLSSFIMIQDDSDADVSISVEDGKGHQYTLEQIPQHIITVGKGITATAIQIDALDRILVCDSYSVNAKEPVYSDLKEYVNAGKIDAGGNVYSSGKAQLLNDIINSTTKGFDKNRDIVFLTGSDTYVKPIYDELIEKGFKYVLWWNDIVEYSDIIGFVKTVSMCVYGKTTGKCEQMEFVSKKISDALNDDVERSKAFYITFSSSNWKVGNKGSLANSMIVAAGGESITTDASMSGSTYTPTKTISDLATEADVIFVDAGVVNSTNYTNLKVLVGESNLKKIVEMNSLWNNYSVESMDGLWVMASAMYPDLFDGDVPEPPKADNSNILLYGAAGAVVIFVLAVMALFIIRKH